MCLGARVINQHCWLFLLFLEYLLKNIPYILHNECEEGEFSDTSQNENDVSGSPIDYYDLHSDVEDLNGEVSTVSEAETFPVLQAAAVYEAEDWDKELEDSECNPYGEYQCACAPCEL